MYVYLGSNTLMFCYLNIDHFHCRSPFDYLVFFILSLAATIGTIPKSYAMLTKLLSTVLTQPMVDRRDENFVIESFKKK